MPAAALNFAATVLAGGHSRRMGTDKAHLPHPQTGQPLLLRQLELLASLQPSQRFVSARHGQELPPLPSDVIRVDDDGTAGPLAGIITALAASPVAHLLIIPVDLPQLTAEVLQSLLTKVSSDKGTYAVSPSGPEPLVAVLPRTLLPELQSAIARGERSPRRLWEEALFDRIEPHNFTTKTPFQNWNSPGQT